MEERVIFIAVVAFVVVAVAALALLFGGGLGGVVVFVQSLHP